MLAAGLSVAVRLFLIPNTYRVTHVKQNARSRLQTFWNCNPAIHCQNHKVFRNHKPPDLRLQEIRRFQSKPADLQESQNPPDLPLLKLETKIRRFRLKPADLEEMPCTQIWNQDPAIRRSKKIHQISPTWSWKRRSGGFNRNQQILRRCHLPKFEIKIRRFKIQTREWKSADLHPKNTEPEIRRFQSKRCKIHQISTAKILKPRSGDFNRNQQISRCSALDTRSHMQIFCVGVLAFWVLGREIRRFQSKPADLAYKNFASEFRRISNFLRWSSGILGFGPGDPAISIETSRSCMQTFCFRVPADFCYKSRMGICGQRSAGTQKQNFCMQDLLVSIETAGSSFPTSGGGDLVDFFAPANRRIFISNLGARHLFKICWFQWKPPDLRFQL